MNTKTEKTVTGELVARDQIQWAIGMWEKAWSFSDTDAFVVTCKRTAQSLRMELATGKPHCSDHLKPISEHRCGI